MISTAGLRIACISSSYRDGKSFIEHKFADRIKEIHHSTGNYLLHNGDIIENCYGNDEVEKYNSMVYDAFIVHPLYQTLLDVIRVRSARP